MAWHELLSISARSHAILQINHVIDLIGSGIISPPPPSLASSSLSPYAASCESVTRLSKPLCFIRYKTQQPGLCNKYPYHMILWFVRCILKFALLTKCHPVCIVGVDGVPQLAECWPGVHMALSLSPSTAETECEGSPLHPYMTEKETG